jgi:hypothetical protein
MRVAALYDVHGHATPTANRPITTVFTPDDDLPFAENLPVAVGRDDAARYFESQR